MSTREKMEGVTHKKYPPEKLNLRLGSEYIIQFNEYMEKHGGKKIEFVRDALNYWMSVDGNAKDLEQQHSILVKEVALREEMLKTSEKYFQERLNDLNRIIEEKDERIKLLQEQLALQNKLVKKLLKEEGKQE